MATLPRPLAHPGLRLPGNVARGRWPLAGAIVLASASAMLPVLQNSSATSRGFRAQSIDAETAQLNGEVSELEAEVARLTSLERVQRRAQQIGLAPSSNPIYVSVDVAGPAPAKIPAEYLPPPKPQTSDQESWWRSLFRWLPFAD